MTEQIILEAFRAAAADFNSSLALMRPHRNEKEGYCEANLVEYFSHKLREQNFRPFLEFPIARGRIDGLFLRDSTCLLIEAKQLYRESVAYIKADLERLASLDPSAILRGYHFRSLVKEIYEIALCDCWSLTDQQQWSTHEFLNDYRMEAIHVPNGCVTGNYYWLLAFRESPNLSRHFVA